MTDDDIEQLFRVWRRLRYEAMRRGEKVERITVGLPTLVAVAEYRVRRGDILGSDIGYRDRLLFMGIPVEWVGRAADPDEAAFRRAIAAEPADDLTRLVFADWLDERGRTWESAYYRR